MSVCTVLLCRFLVILGLFQHILNCPSMLPPRRATLRSHTKSATVEPLVRTHPRHSSIQRESKAISCKEPSKSSNSLTNTINGNEKATTVQLEDGTVSECIKKKPTKNVQDAPGSEIVGRENERTLVRTFIQSAIEKRNSATLYISGAPGTGKTAVVLCETRTFEKKNKSWVVLINCMHLRSASEIFSSLITSLKSSMSNRGNQLSLNSTTVENILDRLVNQGTLILILDEVDQLASQSQDVLYRIFNWPETLKCHIVIIGIANALDLPERLPKLKSKEYQPKHLTFTPYTREELTDIISSKLNLQGGNPNEGCLDPLAVQLCARKISASTGDVRTALDVCRRAIALATQQARKQNQGAERASVRPSLQHISLALKELNGFHQLQLNATAAPGSKLQQLEDLPLHHKLIISGCCILRRQRKKQEVPFIELCEAYESICRRHQLGGLSESELVTICGLLESRGYLEFSTTKGNANGKLGVPARFRRVKLRLDDHAVQLLLSDDLFANILRMTL